MIFKSDPHEFREPKPMQWPWPSPSNERIQSLLNEMQTMNQRLQVRIDELNLRMIRLEEIVRNWNAEIQE